MYCFAIPVELYGVMVKFSYCHLEQDKKEHVDDYANNYCCTLTKKGDAIIFVS